MPKWLRKAVKGAHALVPYLALALTLSGQPECAAALSALLGPAGVAAPLGN